MHSFIKPRKKKIIDDMSSLWIIFIILMSLGLIGFGVYINYKSSFYIKMLESDYLKQQSIEENVKSLRRDIQIFSMQKELETEVKQSNLVLKESVKSLFDLVPDQVTLTDVIMERDSLILKGYSASKESYSLLLEPPLKSIFDESHASFSIDNRGFYRFVSKNVMNINRGIVDE